MRTAARDPERNSSTFGWGRTIVCGILITLARPAASNAVDAPATGSTNLSRWMEKHLSQPRFAAAAWGVKIVALSSGTTLFQRDAGKLLKPASNAKLFTSALALDRLGPDFRIRTSLCARSRPGTNGVLSGDLLVYGRGDPSFAARFHGGSHIDNLAPLAEALAAAGIKRVAGNLLADESFFKGPPLGSGWMWDDLVNYYGAEVSALTFEDNVVDLVLKPGPQVGDPLRVLTLPATTYLTFSNRSTTVPAGQKPETWLYRPLGENTVYLHGQAPVGASNLFDAVTVHRPAQWFGATLKSSLRQHGIEVSGKVRTVDWLDRELVPFKTNEWIEVAAVESPPLREIVAKTLKPSQNLYAQLLLLQVGTQVELTNQTFRTTEDAGLAELERFLAEAGIGKGEVLLEEGSGLSRGTLLMPGATVQLLAYMNRHPHREAFRGALPVAGVDGTLRRRMRGTPAAENAQAKTGTLRHVYTLSGYVTTKAGDELVYSLMLNNFTGEESEGRSALDAIVVHLASLESL